MNMQVDIIDVARSLARFFFSTHDNLEDTWISLTEDWDLNLDHYLGKPRATLYPVEHGLVQVADFISIDFEKEQHELSAEPQRII